MAYLITCDAANVGRASEPVDLLNVGFTHRSAFTAYVEFDKDELQRILNGAAVSLEAEYLNSRLLLKELRGKPRSGELSGVVVWRIEGMPAGLWILRLVLNGAEFAEREVSIGV